ncbi:hypothetical protein [Streptomyces sp. NPDC021224]|uniref:hypothetical protein n=1 Tax=unclassified Streptomyces TaxID=2593676 RepID=UPI00378E6686
MVVSACLALATTGTLIGCSSGNDGPTVKLDGVKACRLLTKKQLKTYDVSRTKLDTNVGGISYCEWESDPSADPYESISVSLRAGRDNSSVGRKNKTDPVDGLRASFASSRDWELQVATGPRTGIIDVAILNQPEATRRLAHDVVNALR